LIQPASVPLPASRLHRPWVFWLLFFFQFAAIGIYFTYLNIYYRNAGLSGTQIGVMNMITALITVISAILWGYLSDRTGQARYFIAAGAVGALIVNQFIPLAHTFWAFLGLASLGSLLNAAPSTLVDSTTLAMLGDRREDYGRYRFGGTIGYIIATLSAGYIFDWIGMRLMFPAYGVIMAFFAITAMLLPRMSVHRETAPGGRRGEIGAFIKRPAWILFTACVFLVWVASNASIMFLGVSLDGMGANQGLIGLAITIGAVTELPFMLYSGKLLRRFGSQKLLLAAMALLIIRFFLLGILRKPEWAVAINMLNGPAFALFWNSSVTYANRMAPSGYSGTAQGFLNSTISLSGMVSSLLTGWLFDLLGGTRLFLVMAVFCLAALILFAMGSRYLNKTTLEIAN
jgi:MFS transporter, PPP family, 3-phenylpropionic acid transporter